MKIKGMILSTCICVFLSTTNAQERTLAQENPIGSHLQLRESSKVSFVGSFAGKARCDASGDLYIRVMPSGDIDPSRAPIKEISADGHLKKTFSLPEDKKQVSAMDFFVSHDGNVYEQEYTRNGTVDVAEFSNDGLFRSSIQLDAEPFIPYQIVVFQTGDLLLSGTLANPGGHLHTPFTALFDSSGKLLKKIYEPEDDNYRQKAEAKDPDFTTDAGSSNAAVYEGDATIGSDGNAYLLRSTPSAALVYVISPKGEVVRKLRVDPPEPGLTGQDLRSTTNNLAISFLQKHSTIGISRVVDLKGNLIADYRATDEKVFPGLPGCYVSSGFVFLGHDAEHNVYVRKAEVQ
jgi:hypothetical protein